MKRCRPPQGRRYRVTDRDGRSVVVRAPSAAGAGRKAKKFGIVAVNTKGIEG